jgi:glycosyltransferase involved in cell wall biosynthesis
VPPGDPASLGAAIASIRADSFKAHGLGHAGRRRVLERFRWSHVVDRCLDAYRV